MAKKIVYPDIEPVFHELKIDEKVGNYIDKYMSESDVETSINVKVDDFDGPLDLLLHLVKTARINIEDIFVSKITDQYLTIIADLGSADLEKASEFIEIASILIEIKSKALLPRPEVVEDEKDPQKELIRRIEEYKLYKEACTKLKEQEAVGMYFKDPDSKVGDSRIILKDMTMDGLVKAMQKLFLKLENKPQPEKERKIALDRFTVADKITSIRDIVLVKDEVNFFELFDSDYTKTEIISTFQAILELLKMQIVVAVQQEIYGDINIRRKEGVENLNTDTLLIENPIEY